MENKLSELDKEGRPVHNLRDLLDNKQTGYQQFMKAFSGLVTE